MTRSSNRSVVPGISTARREKKAESPGRLRGIAQLLIPPVLVAVLAAPCLQFAYILDDFSFLLRGYEFGPEQLLPDSRSAFYRPLSRELYFGLLALLGPNEPFWGHGINLILVAVLVVLVAALARRLIGRFGGHVAGVIFATTAPLPLLVGWVSCSQDILAMVFITAALHLQMSGRVVWALACGAGALLSKEAAIFFFPALASLRFVLGAPKAKLRRDVLQYAGLAFAWGLIHPKLRSLFVHGLATGAGGYVGVDNPEMLLTTFRMATTVLNLPPTGLLTPWPSVLNLTAVAAGGIASLGLWLAVSGIRRKERPPYPPRRVAVLTLLLGLFPALLTVISTKHWFPYYACMPAIGVSLLMALVLVRLRREMVVLAVLVFAALGIWYRGTESKPRQIPMEANWRTLSADLDKVEFGLKRLYPSLPESVDLYVSAQPPAERGLDVHLYSLQAPRVWYRDPSIETLRPEALDLSGKPPLLFWVSPTFDVSEIKLPSLEVRSAGRQPSYPEYQKAMRNFALGVFGAGDVNLATSMLLSMDEPNSVSRAFDHRLAAMFLFASGQTSAAISVRESLPDLSKGQALAALGALLTAIYLRNDLDEAAFQAFEISPDDAEACRYLMHFLSDRAQLSQASRMAHRLLSLRPGDEEALGMIEGIRRVPQWEQIVIPVEGSTQ